MRIIGCLFFSCLLTVSAPLLAADQTKEKSAKAEKSVKLTKQDGKVEVTIDGKPFTTYHFSGYKKPFFSPLQTASGVVITRSLEPSAVTDHPHHKGLWVSVDEVNENKHWMEAQEIRTESVDLLTASGNPAEMRVVSTWLDKDGEPVLKQTDLIRITADRLISYEMSLTPAGSEPVTFGDTKEGFFALRVRDELREKGGKGKIQNSLGDVGEAAAWGKAAPWVDYSGTVDDGNGKSQKVGVAIFDDPSNFRPSRYHVRGYGLFAISPFGERDYTKGANEAKPVILQPGETLRLHFGAYVHDGLGEPEQIQQRYEKFTGESSR